ncbi:MAG: TatD family deoxyribonuclease [Actinobacteria bacterium]|nr:TatD family deoxyribonuclease [Actinomycetota bacterium]
MADRNKRESDRKQAPLPEPLPTPCVDSHAHLEIVTGAAADHADVKKVLDDARSVGIDRVVQVGIAVRESKWSIECANKWNTQVLATVALHPNEAPLIRDLEADLEEINRLAGENRVCAIGETGMDFFRTEESLRDKQRYSFRKHIEIAKAHKKALVIHDRDSHRAVLDLLDEVGAPSHTVFHSFSGDAEMAKECVAKGYFVSFSGALTFKNAPLLHEALMHVPLANLLVETDAPFLTPVPNRGAHNTPAQIPHTLRFMSDRRGEDLATLTRAISNNAEYIFGSFTR